MNYAYELYSYWITLYLVAYLLLQKICINVPNWTNPYSTVIIGTIAQVVLTVLSILNSLPAYFIIGVVIWKSILLYITLKYVEKDFTLKTLLFNLSIFIVYMIILYRNNKNIISVYKEVLVGRNYSDNFIEKRLKHVV